MSDEIGQVPYSVPDTVLHTALAEAPREMVEIALGVARIYAELDEEAAYRYVASGFVDHAAAVPGVADGPQGYLATARYLRAAFSDATWRADDFFTAADRFAVRVTFSGVHTGDFLGIPPTGKPVSVQHMHFHRVANGQVTEHWGVRDELTLLRQIGVFTPDDPTPADAGQRAGY